MVTKLNEAVARELEQSLRAVCVTVGVDPRRAELIKFTINAVYGIGPFVVRLNASPDAAWRTVANATALAAVGAPTVRLAGVGPQPIQAGRWAATVWRRVPTTGRAPLPVDLAAPVRAVHGLPPIEGLRRWEPVAKARGRIQRAAGAAWMAPWSRAALGMSVGALVAALHRQCDRLERALADVRWQLPQGVIHGDVHTGNLLVTETGPDLLCDLDSVATGPREWDLTPPAHGVARMGRPRADYDAFAAAYGFDVMAWDGWPVLRAVRDLQMATSTLGAFDGRDDVAAQVAHRLRSLLAADATAVWTRCT